jgi:predicted nucleotidyltransferase
MRSVAEILIGVRGWAARQAGVSGVALVGSHARGAARADSDVDLVLLCEAPDDLVRDTITYSLMDAYRIAVVHEQNHFVQATRGLEVPGYPT